MQGKQRISMSMSMLTGMPQAYRQLSLLSRYRPA